MKVVINRDYGGYCLSKKAYKFLGIPWDRFGFAFQNDRTNPKLVQCVEELEEEANGWCADLRVVEIPDDVDWYISERNGVETIEEKHRSWS